MQSSAPLLLVLCVLCMPWVRAAVPEGVETAAEHDRRMSWWREARFGLFIHWGIYSVPAGLWRGEKVPLNGEWIMHDAKIPVAEYAKFASEFNPVLFDAEAWVVAARAAGMKYIIITAKHHDGFAMFDSAVTSYDIIDATPFKRDPLRELAVACRKNGMKLGFYYSQSQDWHHAGGAARGGYWDPSQQGSRDAYLREVAYPQVKELLTNYGPVAVLWWDTPEDITREQAAALAPLLKLQPGIISNNRLGGGFEGDTETPENRVPATGLPRDWEACMTMNDTWGFKSWDENWKSSEELIRTLVDIVSKGGNYLLNVGPTSRGEMPTPSLARLQALGRWMDRYGEAIHGTTASPFRRLGWGRATRKGDLLYLHVFDWPTDGKLTVPMRGQPRAIRMLSGDGKPLEFTATAAGLVINLPDLAPDPVASVVLLEGLTAVDPLPPAPLSPAPDGVLTLVGDEGNLEGPGLRITGNTTLQITDWRDVNASVTWTVKVPTTGEYEVMALAQSHPRSRRAAFLLEAGAARLTGVLDGEAGDEFVLRTLGRITLSGGAPVDLTLRATSLPGGEFITLRELRLRPLAGALAR